MKSKEFSFQFMNTHLEAMIYFLFSFLLLIAGISGMNRKPNTSSKISFTILCFSLSAWNFVAGLRTYYENYTPLILNTEIILSMVTIFLVAAFALNFPFFRRRDTLMGYATSFVGGIGFVLIAIVTAEYFIKPPVLTEFVKHQASHLYSKITLVFFFILLFYKVNKSVEQLQKFYFHLLLLVSLSLAVLIAINKFVMPGHFYEKHCISVKVLDLLFLITLVYFLIFFRFWEFHPGIFSFLVFRDRYSLVLERIAPASTEGAQYLKDELWNLYSAKSFSLYLDEFWYNIIIDETLDNAVEHGGKRSMDDITVQVFETQSFFDLYVIDRGKGFDPRKVPDPSREDRKSIPAGRGIHIMKKMFDIKWNFLGNEIKVRISKSENLHLRT